ncbi:flagellar biosynthesis anti-sigma factor FlgM [Sphingomonas sp. Y38-1Y]|uniref:flagellar biosynthesis anti-sigma factor FlgM n=1 Tax=Sphingomonas sp. Y38-1Y TaxID=3078265 RepID=UPI0028E95EEA|nr:flagellar biosynthesis anti-sigma factor FlgM [Sphingomonas sp. Y38-1Y]
MESELTMVDPIGSKFGNVAAATPVSPLRPVQRVANATKQAEASVAAASLVTARDLAAKPPVDADRVARIKKAVEDGSFPIVPTTIADRLLAFKLNWKPDEPA